MLDQHKTRDHVWHSFPLLVVRKTSENLLLPCFSQEINPKLFTDSLSLDFMLLCSCFSWIYYKPRKIIFNSYWKDTYIKIRYGLTIAIKPPDLMAKTCGASVRQPPPNPPRFSSQRAEAYSLPNHVSTPHSHKHVRGHFNSLLCGSLIYNTALADSPLL